MTSSGPFSATVPDREAERAPDGGNSSFLSLLEAWGKMPPCNPRRKSLSLRPLTAFSPLPEARFHGIQAGLFPAQASLSRI